MKGEIQDTFLFFFATGYAFTGNSGYREIEHVFARETVVVERLVIRLILLRADIEKLNISVYHCVLIFLGGTA